MSNSKFLSTIESLSQTVRYIMAIAASVVCFIIVGVVLIYNPQATLSALTIFLPLAMLLLGGIWSGLKLPWALSFLPPAVLFVAFCFTRLNGVASLIYLLGYIPICLAGALVAFSMRRYLQTRGA